MLAHLRANLLLIGGTLVICSILYPLVVYAVGYVAFHDKSEGSIIKGDDDKPLGSSLIAQEFKGDEFFQPRPSATSPGYNASASGGSNFGANNPKLRDRVARQLGTVAKYHPTKDGKFAGFVGDDVEKWFSENPNLLSVWAERYPKLAESWSGGDPLNKEYQEKWLKDHADAVENWKQNHPDSSDEGAFFITFAAAYPGRVPALNEKKVMEPVAKGPDVQGWFFDMWMQADPYKKAADIQPVPADMVTASGSGLDPHISLGNAQYQIDHVVATWAKKKGLDREKDQAEFKTLQTEVENLVNDPGRSFVPLGLTGERLVNVLELNQALKARMNTR
jgi:K+-transporting ATPase ATPase C chain